MNKTFSHEAVDAFASGAGLALAVMSVVLMVMVVAVRGCGHNTGYKEGFSDAKELYQDGAADVDEVLRYE